jgi:hypothetical protein
MIPVGLSVGFMGGLLWAYGGIGVPEEIRVGAGLGLLAGIVGTFIVGTRVLSADEREKGDEYDRRGEMQRLAAEMSNKTPEELHDLRARTTRLESELREAYATAADLASELERRGHRPRIDVSKHAGWGYARTRCYSLRLGVS